MSTWVRVALLALAASGSAGLAACADAGDGLGGTASATEPLVGVDGATDSADRNCHVVLRSLKRNWTGAGWEAIVTPSGSTSWIWQGTVEISEAAQAEGLTPYVLYRVGAEPSWRAVAATAVSTTSTPGTPGFKPYTVRIADGLPGPGSSGSSLAAATIQVAPYLQLAEGGRLFDHNRHASDFDNYAMAQPDFAVGSDANRCHPPAGPLRATLAFAADWSEHQEGAIAPGGQLAIAYDVARLPQCRDSRNGLPLWEITAHVKFATGAAPIERLVSVRDATAVVAVPPTATGVELWFENTSATGCHAWDSNTGANYRFATAHAPQWMGTVQTLISRDSGDPCDGGLPAAQGFSFDTWSRQRAAKANLCFQVYEPGLTDHDDPSLWQQLDVRFHWRFHGEATWHTRPVAFDRRTGNNARYALSWRELDPFRMYTCPPVAPTPTADGQYVALPIEYFLSVNGGELRPGPGAAFAGTFSDYVHDFWRDSNCH